MIFLFFLVFLISYSFPKKEKEEEKKEKILLKKWNLKRKEEGRNTHFQGHFRCKKDLISSFNEIRSFQFCYSKYLMPRIKIFTLDGINQSCENKRCSCKIFLARLGHTFLSSQFAYSFPKN